MIFSDCYGDCSKREFDLIVRGDRDQVKHELMHVLISMKIEDIIEVFDKWADTEIGSFKEFIDLIEEISDENDTDINNDN